MQRTLIIAEAGVNHNGDPELARQLVYEAFKAGADIVKFQTFIASQMISSNAVKAEYQKATGEQETQLDMVKKLELTFDDFRSLKEYAETIGIKFLSTPFDPESAVFLRDLGIDTFKIPSGEITNLPMLRLIGGFGMKVILSTGMATMNEIAEAIKVIERHGTPKQAVTVLHCNTEYPTPMKDVNLKAMDQIRTEFGVAVGYSDHTLGIEVPVAAVALGATVIEKHFTLDKTMPGPDHRASLEPGELAAMVSSIRNIERALGDGIKRPTVSEKHNMSIARKSIHLTRAVKAGDRLTSDNLVMKRPGDGISPMLVDEIIGRTTAKNLDQDHKLSLEDLL